MLSHRVPGWATAEAAHRVRGDGHAHQQAYPECVGRCPQLRDRADFHARSDCPDWWDHSCLCRGGSSAATVTPFFLLPSDAAPPAPGRPHHLPHQRKLIRLIFCHPRAGADITASHDQSRTPDCEFLRCLLHVHHVRLLTANLGSECSPRSAGPCNLAIFAFAPPLVNTPYLTGTWHSTSRSQSFTQTLSSRRSTRERRRWALGHSRHLVRSRILSAAGLLCLGVCGKTGRCLHSPNPLLARWLSSDGTRILTAGPSERRDRPRLRRRAARSKQPSAQLFVRKETDAH